MFVTSGRTSHKDNSPSTPGKNSSRHAPTFFPPPPVSAITSLRHLWDTCFFLPFFPPPFPHFFITFFFFILFKWMHNSGQEIWNTGNNGNPEWDTPRNAPSSEVSSISKAWSLQLILRKVLVISIKLMYSLTRIYPLCLVLLVLPSVVRGSCETNPLPSSHLSVRLHHRHWCPAHVSPFYQLEHLFCRPYPHFRCIGTLPH